jgi:hypothetical protein
VCFDFLYNSCLKYFSFSEEFSEILSQMHIGVHVKYPSFWTDLSEACISLTDFHKILEYQIFTKIRPMGAQAGRHMAKLTAAYRNFANAPKTTASEVQQQRVAIPRRQIFCLCYADACSSVSEIQEWPSSFVQIS